MRVAGGVLTNREVWAAHPARARRAAWLLGCVLDAVAAAPQPRMRALPGVVSEDATVLGPPRGPVVEAAGEVFVGEPRAGLPVGASRHAADGLLVEMVQAVAAARDASSCALLVAIAGCAAVGSDRDFRVLRAHIEVGKRGRPAGTTTVGLVLAAGLLVVVIDAHEPPFVPLAGAADPVGDLDLALLVVGDGRVGRAGRRVGAVV